MPKIETTRTVDLCDFGTVALREGETFTTSVPTRKTVPAEVLRIALTEKMQTADEYTITAEDAHALAEMFVDAANRLDQGNWEVVCLALKPRPKPEVAS